MPSSDWLSACYFHIGCLVYLLLSLFAQSGLRFLGSWTYIVSDEERVVLSKPVVQFSFTYSVSRYFYICLYINHQFLYLLSHHTSFFIVYNSKGSYILPETDDSHLISTCKPATFYFCLNSGK